jgi:hypothetical protein
MMNYNRFDVNHNTSNGDPQAWIAAVLFLTAWAVVAALAFLETFTDILG